MPFFRICICCLLGALTLSTTTPTRADTPTPLPQVTTAPPAVQPTSPPPEPATIAPEPAQSPAPVQVSKEPPNTRTNVGPSQVGTEPTVSVPTPQTADNPGAGQSPAPASTSISAYVGPAQSSTPNALRHEKPAVTTNPVLPPAPVPAPLPADQTSNGTTLPDVNASNASAAAPSQLICHGKARSTSDPFLVAPFSGWTTVNSFLDHDSPDYQLDGKIVVANGLAALAGDGQSSDFFPSYWSPSLRQYISYDGHNGYDFGISYQPVLAAGDGTVTFADWNGSSPSEGYGQMVLIDHHNGYVTLYGHLSKIEAHEGQKVSAGQEIGISGSTGNSSGPHLHFSVFDNCRVTDPYGWTGNGGDPLYAFDGQRASYLWLPGHDPLVLNPPPHWPAFPLGLHISVPRLKRLAHEGRRVIPPIDRLILLDLPEPQGRGSMTAAVALAVAESGITRESAALTPYLRDLRAQGLLDSFERIPAAAAIWVRGTASANELEGLPGVASLSGVQPKDLLAAQAGLAHSVLIQLQAGHAPSLWPLGFRSALETWRPVTTVAEGHALVTGFALPGREVKLSLFRRGSVPAVGDTTADPDTGGFVAMLHDLNGNPVPALSGDVLQISSGGRLSHERVVSCRLRARVHRITGRAPANASVAIAITAEGGDVTWRRVVAAAHDGIFSIETPRSLRAGSQAIASFVNEAGDAESVTSHLPGIIVSPGSSTVRGWAVGQQPQISVSRGGRLLFHRRLHPAEDGGFQMQMGSNRRLLALAPGDRITVGSPRHHRQLIVPNLELRIPAGSHTVTVAGPHGKSVAIEEQFDTAHLYRETVSLGSTGRGAVAWKYGAASPGGSVSAAFAFSTGDVVQTVTQIQGMTLHMARARVQGQSAPGLTLSLRMVNAQGDPLAGAVTTTNSRTGVYRTDLRNAAGQAVPIRTGDRIVVREGDVTREVTVPDLVLRVLRRKGEIRAAVGRQIGELDVFDSKERLRAHRSVTGTGLARVTLRPDDRIVLSTVAASGVTVDRQIIVKNALLSHSLLHRASIR